MSRVFQWCVVWLVCAGALSACASPKPTPACEADASPGWSTLAPGVHVWTPAPDAEPAPENRGHVMPTSVLVHGPRAWVIDPGPNAMQTRRVMQHIRCVWGAQVERVFNTHAHAENVLGNAAFADAQRAGQVQVLANEGTANAMEKRCSGCLADLTQRVGEAAMSGTHIVLPTVILRRGDVMQLGPHRLEVREAVNAHTASDLVLWHSTHRIAFVGGLVYGQRLPELAQGSLLGWRAALVELKDLDAQWVVGATVAGGSTEQARQAVERTDAYLAQLQQAVLQGMESGLQVSELPVRAAPPFDAWAGHDARHGFNLQRAWRELEPAWMDGALRPNP